MLGATGVLGATYTPRLRGDPPGPAGARPGRAPSSAAAVAIHERTRVTGDRAGPGAHRPRHRARRASWSARPRATRRGLRRADAARVVPVYSLIVATEPLPADVWERDRAAPTARRSPTTGT